MKYLKRYKYLIIFGIMLFIPLITNEYRQYLVNLTLVYIMVALGFNIVLGYAGKFSFANAALFGIGAYTVGLLMRKYSITFLFGFPLAGLLAAAVGFVLGFIALRLHRYYLAIVTLAFTYLMKFVYIHGGKFTYGYNGFDIPTPTIFGVSLYNDKRIYYVTLVVFFLILSLTKNIIQSKIGRAFFAIKDDENAAEALSIDSKKTILLAFTFSGFVVGIAGALLCIVIGRITPESFGMTELIKQFIMVVIGGLGSFTGSIIGATIIFLLPEALRAIQEYQELIFGFLVVIFVLFAPKGLYGFMLKFIPGLSREKLHQ